MIGLQPLRPLVAVRYQRMAWQWEGLRVTVDRNVTFFAADPQAPPQLGACIGAVVGYIVEVKPLSKIPDWLKGELVYCPPSELSKSRRALATLRAITHSP